MLIQFQNQRVSIDSKSWSWRLRCILIVRKLQSYKYVRTHIAIITCNIICLCMSGTRASYFKRKLVEYHRVQHRFSAFWLRSSHGQFRWKLALNDGEDLKSFSSWYQSRTISRTELVEIFGGEDAEDFGAVWQMERHDTWYVTFQTSEIVDHYDGKTLTCFRRGLSLHLNGSDRITVKARIHWLPIWVTNEDLSRVLESRGDIKSLHHVTENKIITGIREVVFSMIEGDQNHLPYLTLVNGHRCLLSVPSWPPFVSNARASAIFDINVLPQCTCSYNWNMNMENNTSLCFNWKKTYFQVLVYLFFYCFLACGFCHCFQSSTNLPLTLLQSLCNNTGKIQSFKKSIDCSLTYACIK